MFNWLKSLFNQVEEAPKYRKRGVTEYPRLMHPLARFKEDIALLSARYSFWFNRNHYFILHFTAGRVERKPRDFFQMFLDRGLCTYFIDGNGELWQQHHGDRCGSHVGRNSWDGKDIRYTSTGVEVACSGKLVFKHGQYRTWYGEVIEPEEVRTIGEREVRQGYAVKGHYRKYKPRQEKMIAELMAWHIAMGLPKENILGHDDVAYPRGRKNDPSGALSKPLKVFLEENVLPLVSAYKQS